jgi:hypothetical protein
MINYFKTASFAISIGFLGFISSCQNSDKYKIEIRQLDSLSSIIDTANTNFSKIDTSVLRKKIISINFNAEYFEKNNRDSISEETTKLLAEYGKMKFPFVEIIKEYAEVKNEVEECQEQLNHLIHDLKNETVKPENAANYIQIESIAAADCFRKLDYFAQMNKYYLVRFAYCNPKMEQLVQTLRDNKK